MATYIPLDILPPQFVDLNGEPLSDGSLWFYEAGTSTATPLFSDNTGASIGVSLLLNDLGRPQSGGSSIYLFRDQSIALKVVLRNGPLETDAIVPPVYDNIPAVASFDSTASAKLDAIEAEADVTDATNVGAVVNGTQEYPIPYGDFYLPTETPAGAETQVEATPGLPNYRGYPFSGSTSENLDARIRLPKRWDGGTIDLEIEYTTAATDTDGVVWTAKAIALSDGDAYAQAYGTPATVTDTLLGAAGLRHRCTISNLTVGGTPATADSIMLRIYRDPANASDDASEDMVFTGATVFYQSDALNDD